MINTTILISSRVYIVVARLGQVISGHTLIAHIQVRHYNRKLGDSELKLFERVRDLEGTGTYKARIVQKGGNLERMAVMPAFIADRLLQLRAVVYLDRVLISKDGSHLLTQVQ